MSDQLGPVVKEIEVPLALEPAFDLFTREMESWWPFESHSIYEKQKVSFEFQCKPGGQIIEVGPAGAESVWGTIDEYDRPNRVSFSWHPGRDDANAQRVEVDFELAPGGTRVRLVHSGWESLGERALEVRANYDTGWDHVFGTRFGDAARSA